MVNYELHIPGVTPVSQPYTGINVFTRGDVKTEPDLGTVGRELSGGPRRIQHKYLTRHNINNIYGMRSRLCKNSTGRGIGNPWRNISR